MKERLLRDLASEVKDQKGALEVETFHGLVFREARKAGLELPTNPNSDWYETQAVYFLLEAVEKNGTRFDAIVIDEGQDFSKDWLEVLIDDLLVRDGFFYFFADPNQVLYQRDWEIPGQHISFELVENCRNTYPIAKKVAGLLPEGKSVTQSRLVGGLNPEFVEVSDAAKLGPAVLSLAKKILSGGIPPEELAILTNSKNLNEQLKVPSGVLVDTVHHGKGLEWEAVILALDVNQQESHLHILAYIGESRAKAILYVVGSPRLREIIRWDQER